MKSAFYKSPKYKKKQSTFTKLNWQKQLINLYKNGLSSLEISEKIGFSESKINYWLKKLKISKRSISEAIYLKNNPNGDPFKIKKSLTPQEYKLLGMGLGLYWGEGTKKGNYDVRLSNSDPRLTKKFLEFLVKICQINTNKLKFWLQIFNDTNPQEALSFWCQELNIKPEKFLKQPLLHLKGLAPIKKNANSVLLLSILAILN